MTDLATITKAIETSGIKPNSYHMTIMEATGCDFPTAMLLEEKMHAYNIDFSEASREELVREARIANRLYRMGQTGVWDA